MKYNRILLKLSGESLAGEGDFGINPSILDFFADEINLVIKLGVQVGV
ncbi:MAG: UMP kinase, partial [Ignavibacteria bacterium]|nr:UMP kinase [Ignavibacteria bacterium]